MDNVNRAKLVKSLYKILFPKYITDFMKPDVNVRPGFNRFCLEYPWMLRKFGADGLYDLVCDVADLWWSRRSRRFKRIHSNTEWEIKKREYHFKCAYCGMADVKLTKDHIIPIASDGTDDIKNIVPACMNCNRRKRTKSASQFIRELGGINA